MTTEFASLLAQVIPVGALAVGLEMRALGTRYVATMQKARRRRGSRPTRIEAQAFDAGTGVFFLGIVLLLLAASETTVLYIAGGYDDSFFLFLVTLGINVAFVAPIFEVVHRVTLARHPMWAEPEPRFWVTLVIVGFCVVVIFVMTAATWVSTF